MLNSDILRRCDASELTTFKGGGSALVYFPRGEEEFVDVLTNLESEGSGPYILGGGSNVVLADGMLKRPIVCTRHMRGLTFEGSVARFEAGASVAELMRGARARGLGGLEFLEGVPASLGGAMRMNAGAFGFQMSDFAIYARVLTSDGRRAEVGAERFCYRRGAEGVILGGALRLKEREPGESLALRAKFLEARAKKQPKQPSFGSAFKYIELSPERAETSELSGIVQKYTIRTSKNARDGQGDSDKIIIPAGMLIEECGLKGERRGGAKISELHANFIVNAGGATAGDLLELAELAERRVFEKFGVRLEREFVLLG